MNLWREGVLICRTQKTYRAMELTLMPMNLCLNSIMNKRLSINPGMVKQYSTLVRLQAESERGNPNSETESIKSLKPSESTKIKPRYLTYF